MGTSCKRRTHIIYRKVLLLVMISLLVFSSLNVTEAVADSIPSYDAELSEENAMALLKAYDSNGYYIVSVAKQYSSLMGSFFLTHGSNATCLETTVHESTHAYGSKSVTGLYTTGYQSAVGMAVRDWVDIYTGNKNFIRVKKTGNYFKTSVWAETLPDSLRTNRFYSYVASGVNAGSNNYGPYGLLDELAAYQWGLNNQYMLMDYYYNAGAFNAFCNSFSNNYAAYCEFRFWILGYLAYAYENNRNVYNAFLSNQNFVNAYCTIERRFEWLIKKSEQKAKSLFGVSDYVSIADSLEYRGITTLLLEMSKSKYRNVENALFSKCTVNLYEDSGVTPKTSFTGLFRFRGTSRHYYLKKGSLDNTSGLVKYNGEWYLLQDGIWNSDYEGLVKSPKNGNWYYVRKGKVDYSYSGFAISPKNYNWYYVKEGTIDYSYTGLGRDVSSGNWYYVSKGELDNAYVGIAKSPKNGKWYYVNHGELDYSYTGLVKSPKNGKWYYCNAGIVDYNYTGLARSPKNGNLYYCKNGVVDYTYSGKAADAAGNEYDVVKGVAKE